MMTDTGPLAAHRYQSALMALSPQRRLVMSTDMYSTALKLVRAGISASQGGTLSSEELRREVFFRMFRSDFHPNELPAVLAKISSAFDPDRDGH